MDPTAAFYAMIDTDLTLADRRTYARDLVTWLGQDGFPPRVTVAEVREALADAPRGIITCALREVREALYRNDDQLSAPQ